MDSEGGVSARLKITSQFKLWPVLTLPQDFEKKKAEQKFRFFLV